MPRVHFERLATAVRELKRTGRFSEEQLSEIAYELASACSEFNHNFNVSRFKRTCLGGNDDAV